MFPQKSHPYLKVAVYPQRLIRTRKFSFAHAEIQPICIFQYFGLKSDYADARHN
jgi:hypothetical protein